MARPRTRTDRTHLNARPPVFSRRTPRGAWWAVILGALLIVGLGWLVSLEPEQSPLVIPSSLAFALAEGVILAFVAALWSNRAPQYAVAAAVLTGIMAAGARWELVYIQNSRMAQLPDLLLDLGFTVAYAVLAGIIGATFLRDRLGRFLPRVSN